MLNKTDHNIIRKSFPVLKNNPKLVYLDTANTCLQPQSVINEIQHYLSFCGANYGRGSYQLASLATNSVESVRRKIANYFHATNNYEIIFTASATSAINQIAFGLQPKLTTGDIILLTNREHNSNLLPWQIVAKSCGAKIVFYDNLQKNDLAKIKVVAYSNPSNTSNIDNLPKDAILAARQNNGYVIWDATQAAGHQKIDLSKTPVDFMVASGHKMYAGHGIGIMVKKSTINMQPLIYGGGIVKYADEDHCELKDDYQRLEAGTLNVEGIIGIGAAIDFLSSITPEIISSHERYLANYFIKQAKRVGIDKYLTQPILNNGGSIFTLIHPQLHPHDIALFLDQDNIAVRADRACADLFFNKRNSPTGGIRLSFGIYNNTKDIDKFIASYLKALTILTNE